MGRRIRIHTLTDLHTIRIGDRALDSITDPVFTAVDTSTEDGAASGTILVLTGD